MHKGGRRTCAMQIVMVGGCLVGLISLASLVCAGPPSTAAEEDRRLNREVTLDLQGVTLSDLCWVISRQTGILHEVANQATGDLTASVAGTMTLGELHQALAEVLAVSWKRIGEPQDRRYRYVVALTPARVADETRLLRERDERFSAALAELIRASSASDDEIAKLPRPMQRSLSLPVHRRAIQMIGSLSSSDQARLLAGLPILEPLDALPQEAQHRLTAMADTYNRQMAEDQKEDPRLRPTSPLELSAPAGWQIYIGVDDKFGVGDAVPVIVHLFNRQGDSSDVYLSIGGMLSPAPGVGTWRLPEARADTTERLRSSPTEDPGAVSGHWNEVVQRLRNVLQHPIVSDDYRAAEFLPDPSSPAPHSGEELSAYLDRICRHWKLRWGRAGRVITFQRLNWPELHRAQIPDSRLRQWKDHVIADGRLRLDDLMEMAALSPYQISGLSDVFPGLADRVYQNQDLLLFWKDLPESRRQSAARGELVLGDTPLTLHSRARQLISMALGSEAPLVLANARMQVERSLSTFSFRVKSLKRTWGERNLDLTCPAWLVRALKLERQARIKALQAAIRPEQSGTLGDR
jgi:hypothetical protein